MVYKTMLLEWNDIETTLNAWAQYGWRLNSMIKDSHSFILVVLEKAQEVGKGG